MSSLPKLNGADEGEETPQETTASPVGGDFQYTPDGLTRVLDKKDLGMLQRYIDKLTEKFDEAEKETTRLIKLQVLAEGKLKELGVNLDELSELQQPKDTFAETEGAGSFVWTEAGLVAVVKEGDTDKLKRYFRALVIKTQQTEESRDLYSNLMGAAEKAKADRQQVPGNSGLQPSLHEPSLDFEVTFDNEYFQKIEYNEVLVWQANSNTIMGIDRTEAATLERQANQLLIGGKIDAALLRDLILGCLPEDKREGRQYFISKATDRYAMYANQMSLDPLLLGTSEMFLQRTIYPPISVLLHLFACLQQPSYYAADQFVWCAHSLGRIDTVEKYCFKGKPGAAIRLSANFYVVATVEIKAINGIDQDDLAKCILLTSMSLVAYHQLAQAPAQLASSDIASMQLPFVVGSSTTARLYVTSFYESKNQLFPKVEMVYTANLSIQSQQIQFVARFAVLLKRAMTVVLANPPVWDLPFPSDLSNIISDLSSRQKSSRKRSRESTGSESENRKPPWQRPKNKKDDKNRSSSASSAETSAKQALTLLGNLTNVMYPWHRLHQLTLNAREQRQAEYEFYQQQSPFYFVGYLAADGQKDHQAVFCKVWKDGDRKTNRQEIIMEIEHLRLANKLGVPCPKIVEEATRLDLKLSRLSQDSSTYHVLTMTKAKADAVARCEVFDYAVSLIQAVQMLHKKAGILHCDIKPANVSWDADQHKVLLLDFGHAQRELSAKSYLGTKGYEAPEVLDGQAHTRASDAYSVGITLRKVIESAGRSDRNHSSDAAGLEMQLELVADVAQALTHDCPDQRLTLEQAEILLRSSCFQCTSNEDSLACEMSDIAHPRKTSLLTGV